MSDDRGEQAVDPNYIGQALRRLTSEVASLGDDMRRLTAIVQRPDNSQGRMLEELRALHRQHAPLRERVRQPESSAGQ